VTDKEALKEIVWQEKWVGEMFECLNLKCLNGGERGYERRIADAGGGVGGSWFVCSWWLVASGVGAARRKRKP